MQKPRIPPELRTMSIVPRWSIVWTLNRDCLTNHSWFVVMYAHEIAHMIDWEGPMDALMYLAAIHDIEELITGDIVSPVKREILDGKRAQEFINAKLEERLPHVMRHIEGYWASMSELEISEADAIIKAADRLDALLFLMTEQRMGNGVIAPRIPSAHAMLESAWGDLPCEAAIRDSLWATAVMPSIKAHSNSGGHGV